MMQQSMRHFSKGGVADLWFGALQGLRKNWDQSKFIDAIKAAVQQGNKRYSDPLTEITRFWAAQQPRKEALWTHDQQTNASVKLTFDQISDRSSRLANVLVGKDFRLTPGKSVLVILPNDSVERILLQLACLQNGSIFCPYEPKDFTEAGLSQRIRTLGIDCVITNRQQLEVVAKRTSEPLRPLKKGLITSDSISEPLPVGWNHLHPNANYAETKSTANTPTPPTTPAVRLSINDQQFVEYSREKFYSQLFAAGLWLNREKTSRLIWMRNSLDSICVAPWLFGSSIFQKSVDSLPSLLDTLEENPIDTFCGSSSNYQLLRQCPEQQHRTHLEQLFATQSIDPKVKARWHSLTQLKIHDDYADLSSRSNVDARTTNM